MSHVTALRASSLIALVSCLSTFACSGASPDAPDSDGGASPGAPDRDGGGSIGSELQPLTVTTPVPAGVQCIVTTVTGADWQTISTPVTAGATVASIAFGYLAPGTITVSGSAFNTPCPGTGAPSWTAEPVQAAVNAGVPTSVPLVFRSNTQGSGGITFSQPAVAIAVGPRSSYAVLADGTIRAWGGGENGELGVININGLFTSVPTPIVPNFTGAAPTQIVAGAGYACALHADLSVACWGYNPGAYTPSTTFGQTAVTPVVSPQLNAVQMSALEGNMAFIGGGPTAPLGDMGGGYGCNAINCGPAAIQWSPNGATGALISVAVGTLSSTGVVNACWVTEHGQTLCTWVNTSGSNVGILPGASGPYAYAPATAHVVSGAEPGATGNFACSIQDSGNVACWGSNTYGELGLGDTTARAGAVSVPNLHGVTSMALSRSPAVGSAFSCAVASGNVYCSGSNDTGQLGNGTGQPSTSFVLVPGLNNITSIAVGQAHACALDDQGSVHCWGLNDDGELGDGTFTTRFTPVNVQPW